MAEVYEAKREIGKVEEVKPPDPLWDPKYAAAGLLTIVLAVLLGDLLPRFIAKKVGKR